MPDKSENNEKFYDDFDLDSASIGIDTGTLGGDGDPDKDKDTDGDPKDKDKDPDPDVDPDPDPDKDPEPDPDDVDPDSGPDPDPDADPDPDVDADADVDPDPDKDKDPDADPDKDPDADDAPEVSYKPFLELLFEKNGWEWSDELLEEDSAQGYTDVLTRIVEANSKPEYASEETKRFDEFIRNGGDPKDFMDAVYTAPNYEKMDVEDVNTQKLLMRRHMKEFTKYGDEKIERELKRLEDTEELAEEAKVAFDELKTLDTDRDVKLEKDLDAKNLSDQKIRDENIQRQKDGILASKEIGGFKVTDKDKQGFVDYLYKVKRSSGKTGYQEFLATNENWNMQAAYYAFKEVSGKNFDSKAKGKAEKAVIDQLSSAQKKDLSTNRQKEKKENPDGKKTYQEFVL